MTSASSPSIYPQYCFHLSPTHNAWCLLQVTDVHALKTHPGFEGQNFYFHKNLPIKWVRLVGIIVAIEEFFGRRVYTIDDSSGACIECSVTIAKGPSAALEEKSTGKETAGASTEQAPELPTGVDRDVDVGAVVDIKGSISTFRDEYTVKIEKMKILQSTEQEVALWEKRTKFRKDILDKPWMLSEKQIRRCRREEEGAEAASRKRRRGTAAMAEDALDPRRQKMIRGDEGARRKLGHTGASKLAERLVVDENMKGRYSALGL